jgi:two-component system cell cycle response regulator DivK
MKATIVLAEDNNESRYLFAYILKRAGCEVIQAQNGIEALESVRDRVPDLIIMDIQMPEMDGYEAVTRIRADSRLAKVPIVGLSAFAMATDKDKALQIGFTGYIEKPIELDAFLSELSKYLPALAQT